MIETDELVLVVEMVWCGELLLHGGVGMGNWVWVCMCVWVWVWCTVAGGVGVCRCHWLMEPFVVSAMRQLSSAHPVYKLLKPYFR